MDWARKRHPNRQGPPILLGFDCMGEALSHQVSGMLQCRGGRYIHRHVIPAQNIRKHAFNTLNVAIIHGDHNGAARTYLSGVAALKVARKNDPRILADYFVLMDMPEGPIVIALGDQLLGRARGIVRVLGVAFQSGEPAPGICTAR